VSTTFGKSNVKKHITKLRYAGSAMVIILVQWERSVCVCARYGVFRGTGQMMEPLK
jgi:hypothetical protein